MTTDFHFSTDLEADVEDSVILWAENHGWIARLVSYRGRRGCADCFFFGYGKIVPMEFKKRGGGSVSPAQTREHARLKNVGINVPVVSESYAGIRFLKAQM